MSNLIIGLYFLLILVFVAFGAAIVFHLLYYRINRHVARLMAVIYIVGAVLLLISNFILFMQVDWNSLIENFKL